MNQDAKAVIRLVLETADGCTGAGLLDDADLDWDEEPDAETTFATLSVEGKPDETITVSGDVWRAIEQEVDYVQLATTAAYAGIESALAEQLNWGQSTYRHCDTTWTEEWNGDCSGECPVCGKGDIVSLSWEQSRGLVRISPVFSDRAQWLDLM